ncbi:ankyrin repeat domain-containing protein [Inhella proteolytica]|uniref:Ankyrin repeat domain-containing protein n=1 Tax=Inhella proteolytica TaxID=2795029 RepID=A0A931J3G1_9BURK|nr:ankyrin repeat domain-containing protein [Inhella proteolytica]MBH9576207.1 ankyrin repeat domain-containing protein [Inhella proteolytica]
MSRSACLRSAALVLLVLAALAACTKKPANIFEAVEHDDHGYVVDWLEAGGNPNTLSPRNESLLYIATGPHGGNKVLAELLKACADPNLGAYGYTPLMNAASWVNLPGVELLLAHGADPHQRNAEGETAVELVGLSGGREQHVIARLKKATTQGAPHPSTRRACQGRPLRSGQAASGGR